MNLTKADRFKELQTYAQRFISDRGLIFSDTNEYAYFPGLCDVHVHFREPGFSYKETIKTGSTAAAAGGYTAVCTMPNLSPVPDCMANLSIQQKIIKSDAVINVIPYGAITHGEKGLALSDMAAMSSSVCAFSDDGHGVQNDDIMKEAMLTAASLGKIIAAHCEDNSLLNGGYIHAGKYAQKHGHSGISSESEYRQIARDLELAEQTHCKYHVCHISTKESVSIIRQAKKDGIDVTCETAPHYLTLCENDLIEDGRFKMNPPLRGADDRDALIEGMLDGTVDMISTDHAPHSAEEKSRGLKDSLMGVVGLETAFSVMYTNFVKTGIISEFRLAKLMSFNARARFSINSDIGFCLIDKTNEYTVDPDKFESLGRATPFAYKRLYGKNIMTVYNDNIVWRADT